MRILLAHNNYTVQGGAEVFCHEIGRLLEANGHEVARFSCAEDGLDAPHAAYFPQVAHYAGGNLLSKIARVPRVIYNRNARDAMARLIADFRPDIVHAFAIYGRLTPGILDAAREARVPVVLSCNDYKHICPNYKLFHHGHLCEDCKGGRFHSALRNRCCHDSVAVSAVSMLEGYVHSRLDLWRKNVDCFLFASRFMADKTEEFWGKGRVAMDFLRNPFDATAHHVTLHAGDYMLYFGRLIEEKGVDVLVKAAQRAPDVPVVIVGDGPDRAALEQVAQTLDNVRVVGPAWGETLKEWLRGARAVVVPSLWHENFPYVILQAFAAGKPVIGAERGGIPELVGDGAHGWLFDPLDAEALRTCMRGVCALPDTTLLEMGAAAQSYVAAQFNDTRIYADLHRIYKKVAR
ncbi:MAG: glycosyltransferase [Halieaceae bacterium]|uniref:glycosyltransferase n=1 Tax=Haliea alexandrii TaxID=2448162 RepID=UPI000F0BC909|nr:glycosyltransferase [Haliea alexandrii]MCR9185098.1 glycosyltransferase [Halieaceae bacterium]